MKQKIKKPPKIKQNDLFKIKREFIERNLEGNINWPINMKIVNLMFEHVSDLDFWRQFNLFKKFEHLYWFQKDGGRAYLLKEYDKFIKNKQISNLTLSNSPENKYTLETSKIGADLPQVAAKPKSLQDFLNE